MPALMNCPYGFYKKYYKRIIDVFLSCISLIILSPLICVTALLIKCKLGKPIIFKQERIGRDEKVFNLYKFRSMTNARDNEGELLPDEERFTKFGLLLRNTSIDELPEIINILKGDMSFVGPRPLLPEYLPFYSTEEHHRHDVRPGLTGLAQIKGRSFLSWEQIFQYDIEYVNNMSFITDCGILVKTISIVINRENIVDIRDTTKYEHKLHQPLNVERKR